MSGPELLKLIQILNSDNHYTKILLALYVYPDIYRKLIALYTGMDQRTVKTIIPALIAENYINQSFIITPRIFNGRVNNKKINVYSITPNGIKYLNSVLYGIATFDLK